MGFQTLVRRPDVATQEPIQHSCLLKSEQHPLHYVEKFLALQRNLLEASIWYIDEFNKFLEPWQATQATLSIYSASSNFTSTMPQIFLNLH